jgi:P4 family phage/plasmid primase-like protien
MGDLTAFRAAVSTLFKPGEHAVSLFSDRTDDDGFDTSAASVIWMEDVQDPEKLPPYWFLSTPGWYHPDMGNLEVHGFQKSRKKSQVISGRIDHQGAVIPDEEVEVYPEKRSPFIVFESDDLLFHKDQHPSDEDKFLQKEAMKHAFLASGFPFAVLVDSGSKSIHATVRLEDPIETIHAWRLSPEFDRLQELALMVFGDYDQGVMRHSGRVKLTRTPGAIRENGKPQTIIATGRRVSIADLTAWFVSQLSVEAQQEVYSRPSITAKESAQRKHYLRLPKWRSDLCKPHNAGSRGTEWFYVAKSLMVAGCVEPRLLLKPTPQVPTGQWRASWLWHVASYTFNHFSRGWFFSQDMRDWERPDRQRWDEGSTRREYVREQLKFEGATDPTKNALVDQMMAVQAQKDAQQLVAQLPPVPSNMLPPPHVGGVTGATLTVSTQTVIPAQDMSGEYAWALTAFFSKIPQHTIIKLSQAQGDVWMLFDGKIWIDLPNDYTRVFIANRTLPKGAEASMVGEVYQTIARECMINTAWEENPRAIAFQNGTLYVHSDRVEFKPAHDPADRLRSLVPCHYDPAAQCPAWDNFVRWALPDPSRLSMLQEMFGYTLIPGQPYQSFFMLTGTGSNGKSVVLSVLQAMHKGSFETVALANLGSRFSLGTLGRKRLAIDTEAENVTHQVLGEGNSATAILKAWTGGDPVKIEAKKVQGWSETINAKYIMACNRRPRFADPTKGVWRRLKLLKFEAHIEERQADRNLPTKLLAELPGIVNWAILGLVRLVSQNGFTQSDLLATDLSEYQTDSDSVAQFIVEFLRPAPADSVEAWFDVRPFHTAYKEYCGQMAVPPVGESEFRQRLGMHNVFIGRPSEHDPVMQCPVGFERMPGHQYWAVKGWRCYHPAYTTQSLSGSYFKAATPQFAQQPMQGVR